MKTPSSGISPQHINILNIICSMACSDGELSAEEEALMIEQFSGLLALDEAQQQTLRQELQAYTSRNTPIEELVPQLETLEDRELVLKLGYMVIQASRRAEEEAAINREEKAAYRRLVDLLALPEKTVEEVEWAADQELRQHHNVIHALTAGLSRFFQR